LLAKRTINILRNTNYISGIHLIYRNYFQVFPQILFAYINVTCILFCRRKIIRSAFYQCLLLLIAFAGNLNAQTTQTFNTSGFFTVPAGVISVTVECWGGGGAGGGAEGGSTHSGGGGGGGAYNKGLVTVIPGNSYPVTVGTGGTGVSGANGNVGGTSSFNGLISANGGGGGSFSSASTNTNGGPGGLGGIGGLYSGGNGGNGVSATPYSGGGGGGGGNAANGNNSSGSIAGTGGSANGGSGGVGVNSSIKGNPGSTLGGGGSGGTRTSGSGFTAAGGNGAVGSVVITWTSCTPFTANITAQYCARVGYIRLTANGGGPGEIYLWSTGDTTNPIDINIAGVYSVTITNSDGCTATANYSISTELVVNGDFSAGNTGFTHSTYVYEPDIAGNSELVPEGRYGIGTDPQAYHSNFWGRDHSTGTGNFMIVNGYPGAPQPVVWSETVTVVPGISYYFSAWAISLNSMSNYATLQFSVNSTLVGTTAPLPARAQNNNPPYDWVQFYGTWTAPAGVTFVPIEIVDFQTAATGNDFGLDDISFATLAPIPVVVTLPPAISVCSGGTLNLSPTLTGGKPTFVYSWTGPNGFTSSLKNPSISNVSAANTGVYEVSVTDGYGCAPVIATTNVTVNTLSATFTQDNVLCNGTSTGSVVITPTGGTLPYTITPSQTNLAAGSYTFTVTDANNCSLAVPVTITQLSALSVAPSIVTNVLCHGESTGSVVLTPSGGVGPYSITPAQTNLAAGSYTFTITDANNCTLAAPVNLTEPSAMSIVPPVVTNVLCHGTSTGSVTITPSGGVSPYTITPAQTNLAAGSYTFTVKDANNCTLTVPATITEPSTISVAPPVISNVLCHGASTGSVIITPSGGIGPYTITPAQTNLAAGNYTFTVKDANNCTLTVPITITEPFAVSVALPVVSNVLCHGASTGSVVITPSGGIGPYTITPTQTNLAAGNYTFTVEDSSNCTLIVPVTITEPQAISVVPPLITNMSCNGVIKGSVIITPSGGVGPYSITPSQVGLEVGSYIFTVTDANNCSVTVPVTIIAEVNAPPVFGTLPVNETVQCDMVPAPAIVTATDDNGIPTVTFSEVRINGSCPYNYSLIRTWTVTDDCGLSATYTQTIVVEDTTPPEFTVLNKDFCVEKIMDATGLTTVLPEWYLLKAGSTDLDISGLSDNCTPTANLLLHWQIDFADGTSLTGVGQPSVYGSDIRFNGTVNADVTHHITYWLVDQCGNQTVKQSAIIIHPRPQIIT
jgi:hypothetical protein